MVPGFATAEGTARFAARQEGVPPQNYRRIHGLALSNVGMGTYLGDADAATDSLVADAVRRSVASGVNVIDTAINYRAQKAERSVGRAISGMVGAGEISRDEIFVSTKNGYVTNDADVDLDFWPYVNREYVQKGVVSQGDISAGYHCMSVGYLEDQLERSLRNLDLECVDLMYLHNAVEGQIKDTTREDLLAKLGLAFELYERKRGEGKIRYYGMATWESLRVPRENPQYLPLDEILDLARRAGGDGHGFRFVQLPFNMYYDQALLLKNHSVGGAAASALGAALSHGVGVFSSVPFMQGRLLRQGAMPEFGGLPPNLRALQFIRSAPGVVSPLVGHKSPGHVEANLKIMGIPPMGEGDFGALVKRLTG